MDHHLNPPSWTLRAELVCSLALPFLFFIGNRRYWLRRLTILGVLIVLSLTGGGNLRAWSFMFFMGMIIPDEGRIVFQFLKKIPGLVQCIMVMAAFNLLYAGSWGLAPEVHNCLEGVCADVFIGALVYGPEMKLYRVLDWLPSRLYGRISYSFYLYHMICLYVVAKAAFVWIPVPWLCCTYHHEKTRPRRGSGAKNAN